MAACVYPLVVSAQTPTRILYVDASSTCVNTSACNTSPCTGCPCGGSWGNNAFKKLQDAIVCTDNLPSPTNPTVTIEQIWVARGKYVPSGTFNLKNTVQIYGGFVGTETLLAQRPLDPDPYTISATTDSVLSGDLSSDDMIPTQAICLNQSGDRFWTGDGKCVDAYGLPKTRNGENALNVVTAPNGTDRTAVLNGFTITAGNATGGPGTTPEFGGGGIRLLGIAANAGATVRNCAILYNRAENGGGGVYGYGYLAGDFVDCVIAYNRADHGGGLVGGKGTGLLNIVNCQLVGNVAESTGGGAHFELNTAYGPSDFLTQKFVNTLIANNRAGAVPGINGSAGKGGGVYAASNGTNAPGDVSLFFHNCTVYGNRTLKISGTGEGGGIHLAGNDVNTTIENSIVWGNVADDGQQIRAGVILPTTRLQIYYSDVRRFNSGTPDEKHVTSNQCSPPCNVFFVAGNLGHLAAHDPYFVDVPNNPSDPINGTDRSFDVSLKATSPCIDAAANPRVPQDIVDLDSDGITTNEHTPLDLRRQTRFANGATTESGVPDPEDPPPAPPPEYPSPFIVDMGAYEFQANLTCTSDADCQDVDPWIEQCVNGTCVECTSNANCQDADAFSETCVAGQCVDCTTDTHCDADNGERCVNGRCVDDFRIIPEANVLRRNRFLSFSVTHPGPVALRVLMLDLQNPNPPNLSQFPPQNFNGYEFGTCAPTTCVGGSRNGFICTVLANCPRACVGGTNAGALCSNVNECTGGTCPATTCSSAGESNEDCARWVGKPGTFLESQDTGVGDGTYRAARLQCTAFYLDWSGEGEIKVIGAEIIPSSDYVIQLVPEDNTSPCITGVAGYSAVSCSIYAQTARWGDVATPFNPPATSTQPDALDVAAVVNKFNNLPGDLPKAITQLQPNLTELNADVNALDIVAVIDAVLGVAYPYSGPCACPSAVTCGSTACSSPTVCASTYGPWSMCVKTCSGGANAGDPCINNTHCNYCSGGTYPGLPCDPYSPGQNPCPGGGSCGVSLGICGNIANPQSPGFCRDRCGRCTPPEGGGGVYE